MDIRLKKIPIDFDGNHYEIAVNMNVLADVQELNGGDFSKALQKGSILRSLLQFLAAAINDAADEQGIPARYTPKQVGRLLPMQQFTAIQAPLMEAITAALRADPEPGEEKDEKKQETTQAEAAE